MTLANPKVTQLLEKNFVCAWKNIQGTDYAGTSNKHFPEYAATEVETCAGHNNVQMFFMTADGRVLNCLPGFWDSEAFLSEAQLAIELNQLYLNTPSIATRNEKFLDAHLNQFSKYDSKMLRKSQLTGFDQRTVEGQQGSDFKRKEGNTKDLKSTVQIVHERMAERPFTPFESFDVKRFVDMGQQSYSYHFGIPSKPKNKRG